MQQFGLEMLILADGWKTDRDWEERLRMALVAAGTDPVVVFPDLASGEDVDPADDAGRDLDYTPVDWAQDVSPDDWQLLQEQLASTRVTVSGRSEERAEVPVQPEVPDVDFDREWQ